MDEKAVNPIYPLAAAALLLGQATASAQAPSAQRAPDAAKKQIVPPPKSIPLLSNSRVTYTNNERRAVAEAKRLQARRLRPSRGVDGSVRYVYGEATAVIVCAPLRICDLALEPGENVKDVLIGDAARWTVEPALSGDGENLTTHAVIKTQDVGLTTNLMITTDRRVYHLTLKSAKKDHMPFISFSYPVNTQKAWASLRERSLKERSQRQAEAEANAKEIIPGIGLSVSDLNFAYEVTGDAQWKPQRVFDDGVKTYLELPPSAVVREAPILLVPQLGKDEIVNYRLKDNRYVVDGLISELILVRGVGRHQERVTVRAKVALSNVTEEPDITSNVNQ